MRVDPKPELLPPTVGSIERAQGDMSKQWFGKAKSDLQAKKSWNQGSRRLNRSGSNHDELDAPYDMSSKRSFHSFRNNKKAPDGAIYDINDDEEDVEESADMQPMHDNLVNDEKKEYKPDDDIFYFENDGWTTVKTTS